MDEALFNESQEGLCEGEERLEETERSEKHDQRPPERVEEDTA